jgi:hypothetical protein
VFLRQCLENGELVACVRDPETGDVLQLSSNDWLPSKWCDYVPPGIWDDYLDPEDYESPGPSDSFVRGALRPVFFRNSDFEPWFQKLFFKELSRPLQFQSLIFPIWIYQVDHINWRRCSKRLENAHAKAVSSASTG